MLDKVLAQIEIVAVLLSEVGPDFEHLARNQAASIHSSGAVMRLCPAHLFLGGCYLEIENRYGASRIISSDLISSMWSARFLNCLDSLINATK